MAKMLMKRSQGRNEGGVVTFHKEMKFTSGYGTFSKRNCVFQIYIAIEVKYNF